MNRQKNNIPVSLLIKPASAACNLNCDYCFYRDLSARRSEPVRPVMSRTTARTLISKALELSGSIVFSFQGGEPTLAGLQWYRDFVDMVDEANTTNARVEYSIQTNGTLLSNRWAEFFHEKEFLVGLSIDGFPRLSDVHRRFNDGKKTSSAILNALEYLQQHEVKVNVLTVVTSEVVDNFDTLWAFFLSRHLYYQQYIPCMDPIDGKPDSFLSPKEYGEFLVRLSRKWISSLSERNHSVSIRLLDNFVSTLMGNPSEQCGDTGICTPQYVIESDGSVYPCDFYCTDEMLLGNINDASFRQFDGRRAELRFIEDSETQNTECRNCDFRYLCGGGCKRNRLPDGTFRFCESYKYLFDNMGKEFLRLAGMLESVRGVQPAAEKTEAR